MVGANRAHQLLLLLGPVSVRGGGGLVMWGVNPPQKFQGIASASAQLNSDVLSIASNDYAFAALKADGSVVAWGDPAYGGLIDTGVAVQLVDVSYITSNSAGFAAIKNGTVVTWGNGLWGGDSSNVSSLLREKVAPVTSIVGSDGLFVARRSDGSTVPWPVDDPVFSQLRAGVVEIVTTGNYLVHEVMPIPPSFWSFTPWGQGGMSGPRPLPARQAGQAAAWAVLTSPGGAVVVWGHGSYGGRPSSNITAQLVNVRSLASTEGAFAALKTDGSVVAWGRCDTCPRILETIPNELLRFPNSPTEVTFGEEVPPEVQSRLVNVSSIAATKFAFAALKTDGSVVAWGETWSGATWGYTYVGRTGTPTPAHEQPQLTSGVVSITANDQSFAALKSDGTVFGWGSTGSTGRWWSPKYKLAGFVSITASRRAFAALRSDGSLVGWEEHEVDYFVRAANRGVWWCEKTSRDRARGSADLARVH